MAFGAGRYGYWYETITTRSFYAVTNAPGGLTNTLAARWAFDGMRYGRNNSPVNSPLNAARPGHAPPGLYKASWNTSGRGSNWAKLTRSIGNSAPHADVVEFGHPSTKGGRWEKYAWAALGGNIIATRGTGAWRSGLGTVTGNGRRGYGLVRRAGQYSAYKHLGIGSSGLV